MLPYYRHIDAILLSAEAWVRVRITDAVIGVRFDECKHGKA
jgi:hypothetical protein